jgi:hypothetical protein
VALGATRIPIVFGFGTFRGERGSEAKHCSKQNYFFHFRVSGCFVDAPVRPVRNEFCPPAAWRLTMGCPKANIF